MRCWKRIPASLSFPTTAVRCSRGASTRVSSPRVIPAATMKVPASMRSAMMQAAQAFNKAIAASPKFYEKAYDNLKKVELGSIR